MNQLSLRASFSVSTIEFSKIASLPQKKKQDIVQELY